MKNKLIKILKLVGLYKTYVVPQKVTTNYISLTPEKQQEMQELVDNYCVREDYNSEENRQTDIDALLSIRMKQFRENHIPFLVETIGLKNKRVLEIGCGSAASSVALCEQGALLTGVDIDERALELAHKRTEIYGVNADFHKMNATDIDQLENSDWDVIIFFASIEHMTPEERKVALNKANKALKKGGHLCIFGTPNRLWPVDIHTSWLPFYMWLQDEIAFDYSKHSSRKEFSVIHKKDFNESYEAFYRWGRGVSFHEIELALDQVNSLKVIGSLPIFLRRYSFIQKISYKRSPEYKYKSALQHYGPPNIHPGFYECYLDIIIEK